LILIQETTYKKQLQTFKTPIMESTE